MRVLGYPIETVLAERLATAIVLGAANTRVRDYADVSALTGRHESTGDGQLPPEFATFLGVDELPPHGDSTSWQYWVIDVVTRHE